MASQEESRRAVPLDMWRHGARAAADLRRVLRGPVHLPGDAEYDEARRARNPAVDPRPAVVAVASGGIAHHDAKAAAPESARHGTAPRAPEPARHGLAPRAAEPVRHGLAPRAAEPARHGTAPRAPEPVRHGTAPRPAELARHGTSPRAPEHPGGQPLLTREILTLAAVVVLGSIMTILDATIVNVALPTLGRDFHTSITTIQWVPTIYLLAFASVIPASGWASERFGARRVWLVSLAAFIAGSAACGLSQSVGELIGFRVLQGLGGGMIMPVGQAILAGAAGPKRMGRVMSIVGVPLLLGPVIGPAIGGAIVGGASWRWIFFVNLPVGAAALVLAAWLLPGTPPRRRAKLDMPGLALLSGGIAVFLYGLAEAGHGSTSGIVPVAAIAAGLALVAAFCLYGLRARQPLIDLRLLRRRGFAAACAANLMLGIALFGVALLLPLYLEIVRGRTPLQTGLLLIPQGLGAALAMPAAGALTDRVGARPVVTGGVILALAGTAAYTQIAAGTAYWYLASALLLIGAGLGATITPSMAAAFQAIDRPAIPAATAAISTIQRIAGSLGTVLLAVTLQRAMTAHLPGFRGGITQAAALAAAAPARTLPALASAFGTTFWVALALTAASLAPALLLPGRPAAEPTGRRAAEPPGRRAAEPTGRRAAEPPGRRAAEPTGRRAAEPPGRRAAEPPGRRAAEPPGRRAAEPPGHPAAEPPGHPAAEPPGRRSARTGRPRQPLC
jgi:EmrB/QacA subfamily drug resistance transporter